MNTTTPAPRTMPLPQVTFYVHGFGLLRLPPLHMLEDAGARLLGGDYGSVLMEDAVPVGLVETLKGVSPSEAARFFFMWSVAGLDFEAAAWGQTLSLHRTLPVLSEVAPGYEDEDDGEPEEPETLWAAAWLHDQIEDINEALLESWALR